MPANLDDLSDVQIDAILKEKDDLIASLSSQGDQLRNALWAVVNGDQIGGWAPEGTKRNGDPVTGTFDGEFAKIARNALETIR